MTLAAWRAAESPMSRNTHTLVHWQTYATYECMEQKFANACVHNGKFTQIQTATQTGRSKVSFSVCPSSYASSFVYKCANGQLFLWAEDERVFERHRSLLVSISSPFYSKNPLSLQCVHHSGSDKQSVAAADVRNDKRSTWVCKPRRACTPGDAVADLNPKAFRPVENKNVHAIPVLTNGSSSPHTDILEWLSWRPWVATDLHLEILTRERTGSTFGYVQA